MQYMLMMPSTVMICLRHVLWLLVISLNRGEETTMQRLKRDLLKFYSNLTAPLSKENNSEQVVVYLQLHLRMILGLEMREQTLKVSGWLESEWMDSRLQWDPKDYDNITHFHMHRDYVWLPDFTLDLAAERSSIGKDALPELTLHYDGSVNWNVVFFQEIRCTMDIHKYPYDTQKCMIRFKSSVLTNRSQTLQSKQDKVDLRYLVPNGEYDIYETSSYSEVVDISRHRDYYRISHTFDLYMRRRVFFYVLTISIPVGLLSCMNVLVFVVPCDTAERMYLGLAGLLAFTLYRKIITETIPKISEHTPILIIYLTVLLCLSLSSIICAAIVLKIHRMEARGLEVPQHLRRLYGYYCLPVDEEEGDQAPNSALQKLLEKYSQAIAEKRRQSEASRLARELDDK